MIDGFWEWLLMVDLDEFDSDLTLWRHWIQLFSRQGIRLFL